MLQFSRKETETLIINDTITLVVLGIEGDQVRLGVQAPEGIAVQQDQIDAFQGRPEKLADRAD